MEKMDRKDREMKGESEEGRRSAPVVRVDDLHTETVCGIVNIPVSIPRYALKKGTERQSDRGER
jgi:hypothetical protein